MKTAREAYIAAYKAHSGKNRVSSDAGLAAAVAVIEAWGSDVRAESDVDSVYLWTGISRRPAKPATRRSRRSSPGGRQVD